MPAKYHSNTLIITDQTLLHPQNEGPLQETLQALKHFVNNLDIKHKLQTCIQILHLPSLHRILILFSNSKITDLVYEYLSKMKIRVGFARNDNKLSECNNESDDHSHSISHTIRNEKLDPNGAVDTSPINERYPSEDLFENSTHTLRVPSPVIQMQSPPASPYEGWIHRPEDGPSDVTIGFHPKKLGHILYTKDDSENMKKVFSSTLEFEADSNDEHLEKLNLGEGLGDDENEDAERDVLYGSLFQHQKIRNESKTNDSVETINKHHLQVPIVIVDKAEAENLKKQALQLDTDENC